MSGSETRAAAEVLAASEIEPGAVARPRAKARPGGLGARLQRGWRAGRVRLALAGGPRGPRVRRLAAGVLLWAALAVLLWAGFGLADQLGATWPATSLRYRQPLSGQAARQAREWSVQNSDGDAPAPWPTYWAEGTALLDSALAQANVPCIQYSGEGALVWPARFLAGGWPGATDEAGCVLSQALAFRLWGSGDVVGKTLELDGQTFTVRGVFVGTGGADADELVLASVSERTGGWQGVELPGALSREQATEWATASALGSPAALLVGGTLHAMARTASLLPVLLLLSWGLAVCLKWLLHRLPLPRWVGLLGVAFVLALALPALLALLPDSVVPNRWSDFAHWGALGRQWAADLRGFLGLPPGLRDVEGKLQLLALAALALTGLGVAVALGRSSFARPGKVTKRAALPLKHAAPAYGENDQSQGEELSKLTKTIESQINRTANTNM